MALCCSLLQDEPKTTRQIFKECVGSVVAVRGWAHLGEQSGAGVVISEDGLILCSYTTVPEGSEKIRVWFKGPKLYTAEYVAGSKHDEVSLIRIKPDAPLTPIRFGESAACDLGQAVFSIGNAQNSFINDDQPSFQRGIISGRYVLTDLKSGAYFRGELFETTAAVNEHMDGGVLLNDRGEMIGMITLNYTPNRWMGHAIPVDWIRKTLDRLKHDIAASTAAGAESDPGSGALGFTMKDEGGKVVVDTVVENGPADTAGLRAGDAILRISGEAVADAASARKRLDGLAAGSWVWLEVDAGGDIEKIKLRAEKK
ncbi:MAG: hypothetical protein A3F84_28140 [Candidatus Handelsmanbacteria bacterium RIFCSPLOWO2_12_FULL_64_10]|uniref:PDZ domain-containing protein n=1 Tax=Handelsmanbacteria sp. (strain RIFCSPLOWO2_12_FULL_64_10) TaxID=1817868 RepID=A0A1F6CIB6_HANXR|nr:MAG: hypothetical protein A3F84_28140 [Candidatus Handelsmanbacteria bacterium RIFCSPLOWO2_12_FULL_64_10]